MLVQGDYVKIIDKESYGGKFGKFKGFDAINEYKVKILHIDKTISCSENQIEKVSKEFIENSLPSFNLDGVKYLLFDYNLSNTSSVLKYNRFFKGLYALGKYYSTEYPEKHEKDPLTNLILKLKVNHINASDMGENISNIFQYFIAKSNILTKTINKINYIVMLPSKKYKNHVEYWGNPLSIKLKKRIISVSLIKDLSGYIWDYNKPKRVKGAFKIDNNNPSLKEKKCLIFDDICTTGNQINELTNLLVNEGVSEVYAFVIGKTKY